MVDGSFNDISGCKGFMKSSGKNVNGGFVNTSGRCALAGVAGLLLLAFILLVVVRVMHAKDVTFLNAEEKSWLAAHPVIRVAPDPDYPPIEYFDGSGAYRGLAADYIALLEEKLGLRFRILRLKSWEEVLEKTKAGEIDVWGAAAQTAQRSEYMRFTEPYVEFPSVIIVRENVTASLKLENLYGMKVAIVSGYADHDYLKYHYPNLKLDDVPTVETGLRKVSFGMVDALVANLGAATYGIEKAGITNLRLAGDTGYVYRLGIGVRKDWPELTSILQKALAQIGPAQRTTLFRRWVRLEQPGLLEKRGFWLTLLAGAGTLALIFAGLLTWNRSLKTLVDQKTAELREELRVRRQAEEALEMAHWELELRVEERTAELMKANIALQTQIAQREQAEEALVESEQRYREVFEYTSDGIFLLDVTEDGRFRCVDFNPAEEAITGRTTSEVFGKCVEEIFPKNLAEVVIANFRRCIEAGKPVGYDEKIDFSGRRMDFFTTLIPLKNTAGRVYRILGVAHDITERKRAEEALRRSEERYRLLFHSFNDGVTVYEGPVDGRPGKFVEVNDAACKMSGYTREELLRMSPVEFVKDPDTLEKLPLTMERLMAEGRSLREEVHTTRDGAILPLEVIRHLFVLDGKPMVLSCARDISERKQAERERERLEEQLRHAQKMEAIGTLAGGIAHDFNNILAAIIGYTEIMLGDASSPSGMRDSLKLVLKAAMRAKDLVRQILVFSRMKGMGERLPVDVGELFRETVDFLRATLPASIEIRLDIEADSGATLADSTQLQQVLVNLCTNAAHAMEETGGVLGLALEEAKFHTETEIAHTRLKPGSYLLLTVSDTGRGMGQETLERIFDPYFTTKDVGKGSGLGLAVVRGVVDRHEGAVMVRSEPGRGTTFQVYLPRTLNGSRPKSTDTGALPRGTERILFVDDEESLVAVAEGMLGMLGYRVEGKTDCVEAMAIFRAAPDRYDLVITDYTMPRMNGVDFAKEIIKIRPRIPVILCTGFSERINEEKVKGTGIRAFAMKPLSLRETAELLRSTLDGRE